MTLEEVRTSPAIGCGARGTESSRFRLGMAKAKSSHPGDAWILQIVEFRGSPQTDTHSADA